MTPYWDRLNDLMRVNFHLGPQVVFSLLMLVLVLIPLLMFWSTAALSAALTINSGKRPERIFTAFAYSLIPIALFYHVAHNGMHFFMEAQHILPLLSDPFGWGWNLFGTAGKTYPALLPLHAIWWMQITMIFIGHLYGVIVADRIAHRLYADQPGMAIRSLIPLMVMMVIYSAFSVWLIAQPMVMRSGM